jgi:hypothetical protein
MTQAPFPMAAPPSARSGRPGPGLGVSISLLVLGAVIGIASAVAITIPLVGTFTSREYIAPAHLSLYLHHARYTVYERSGSSSGFGVHPGVVTIVPSQVTVTAPDGEPVAVFRLDYTETITRQGQVYTGAVRFDARTTGNYDIRLTNPVPTSVLITRSLGDAIRSVLVWIGTGAVGGIIFVAGLVMLIVGVTRRGRARRATQLGWGQPGWGQPAWGQAGWGEAGWGQPAWGQPPQYTPSPYPPPPYPPPQYAPPPPPPPPPTPPPPTESPAPRSDESPDDPWAPK